MALASFVDWLLRRSSEDRASDNYIEVDRTGKARFDVAGYLASEEGGRTLAKISDANKRSSRNLDEAA